MARALRSRGQAGWNGLCRQRGATRRQAGRRKVVGGLARRLHILHFLLFDGPRVRTARWCRMQGGKAVTSCLPDLSIGAAIAPAAQPTGCPYIGVLTRHLLLFSSRWHLHVRSCGAPARLLLLREAGARDE